MFRQTYRASTVTVIASPRWSNAVEPPRVVKVRICRGRHWQASLSPIADAETSASRRSVSLMFSRDHSKNNRRPCKVIAFTTDLKGGPPPSTFDAASELLARRCFERGYSKTHRARPSPGTSGVRGDFGAGEALATVGCRRWPSAPPRERQVKDRPILHDGRRRVSN